MSHAATYRYGNKNNWRRWAWNRIAEHCPVPKSEARVLIEAQREQLRNGVPLDLAR